jgi:hypothetical protein
MISSLSRDVASYMSGGVHSEPSGSTGDAMNEYALK